MPYVNIEQIEADLSDRGWLDNLRISSADDSDSTVIRIADQDGPFVWIGPLRSVPDAEGAADYSSWAKSLPEARMVWVGDDVAVHVGGRRWTPPADLEASIDDEGMDVGETVLAAFMSRTDEGSWN